MEQKGLESRRKYRKREGWRPGRIREAGRMEAQGNKEIERDGNRWKYRKREGFMLGII